MPSFIQVYNDNLQHLELIRLKGGEQYSLNVTIGLNQVEFLNTEFTLSLIDNANLIASAIAGSTTQAQLVQAMQAEQMTAKNYLQVNCLNIKEVTMKSSNKKVDKINTALDDFSKIEGIIVGCVFLYLLLVTVGKFIGLVKIRSQER